MHCKIDLDTELVLKSENARRIVYPTTPQRDPTISLEKATDWINTAYIPTQKNKPVADFYNQCGFKVVEEKDGTKSYALEIEDYVQSGITYIETKTNK